ncbi:FecR domain-containing protein [Roseibium sp.]|uniref:FecR domain-containing protein n=1 Tax=Roseibium sp. TaxID=1936156 RepID=UPI00391C26B5
MSGVVYFVAPEVKAFRVQRGMVFQPGYTMATRSGARALIARGAETISVGPNAKFALSKYRSNNRKTTLLQRSGRLTVDVQKRGRPHFTVETPFLAAVVKGTRFGVSVNSREARVSVERGLVEVSDLATGQTASLGPGQSASSAPGSRSGLSVSGVNAPSVSPGAARAPAFATPSIGNVPSQSTNTSNQGVSGGSTNSQGQNAGGNSGGAGYGSAGSSSGSGESAGNNGSGNGNGNGNSGNNGNGNGNSGNNGNGNGNSGNNGNGNGNSGNNGNGNGNSGNNGNGNGNSGNNGNGNGNSGNNGNGNGNSGNNGNGNGNSGNNGNGNGNSGTTGMATAIP